VAAGVGRTGLIQRFPRGPVLAIAPFNFPLNLVAHKVGPAVAAGCPVVIKPAEQTPSAALVLGEILVEAGWPAEAISVLPCDRSVAGALVDDPRLPVISFTGSDRVGWSIRARVPRKQVVLELGGNAAAILHADCDLGAAIPRVAAGAFAHAGQVCISVQHILIHASLYNEARDRLIQQLPLIKAGNPADADVVCGPMIDAFHAGRVESWIAEACQTGAKAHGGGRVGSVLLPSVVEGVPSTAKLSADEVFGPAVVLTPYANMGEAVQLINAGRYGLQCGVYTQDISTLWQAFGELEVGAIIHNDFPTFRVDSMPYGGVKDSGVGREGPRWAIRDFTEERMLVLRP
jgi:acyl-CoA reductase-like NAD-dependent aldehyde dehydrogenase